MAGTIQIPKFDASVTLPPEAVQAPDAPMNDNPSSPPVAPTAPDNSAVNNFMDSVREANIKRSSTAKTSDQVTPTDKPAKPSNVPPVFAKQAESDDVPDVPSDSSTDDSSSEEGEDFVDPLAVASTEKPNKAKSIKQLKSHLNTARAREAQLRTKAETLEKEVQRLSGFQERMEEHEKLKERVAQLETYEKIFDVHNNPEFQEKYVAGAESVSTQAGEIAKSYGVADPAFIAAAVRIRDRRELNKFLHTHLKDELGVQDVRPYVFHLQALEDERVQLEKSPEQAREILSKMYREGEDRRVAQVSKTIHERSGTAWNQILGYYSTGETAIDAFKDKPGDPEHTERRSTVFNRANQEYVKVMGAFAGLGLKDLPAPIAHTLAARFQLSEWAGEFNAENQSLKLQVAVLTKQLADKNSYSRPAFNGTNRTNNGAAEDAPKGAQVAEHVFNRARDQINSQNPR